MPGGVIEREVEDRAISAFLTRAETGATGLVVEGDPGIGKTTLMLDTADLAVRRGFHVLAAHGSPAEVRYAYAALVDLIGGFDAAVLDELSELQRIALQRMLSGAAATEGPATDERIVASAFLSIMERMSAHAPVLVAIDDVQWLDTSSRAVISYAARRLTGPIGLLMIFRTDESVHADALSWLDFRRPEAVTRMRMRPLSLGGVHTLLTARLGHTPPRPTIVRIYETSGGNPFFALELAAHALSDESATAIGLPDSLAALVRSKVGQVDENVAAVLLAVASAAAPTVELISSATETSPAQVVAFLETVESRGIVTIEGNRVRFSHPLFATGVYTVATASQRRAMHRALAAVVEEPELKARHLALAATTADAATLTALDTATDATSARGAPAVAAELMELALGLDQGSPHRQIRAAELHFRAGSLAVAREYLEAVLRELAPGLLRCMALMWLGAVKGYDDDTAGAVEAMSQAADQADDYPPLKLLCLLRLALALVMADRLDEALERSAVAVDISAQVEVPDLRSQALSIHVAGRFAAGLGVDTDALQTALQLEDPRGGATTWFRASAVQAMMSAYTGDLEKARGQLLTLQQRMLEGGTEVDIIWAAVHMSAIALWRGEYPEATEAAQEAVVRAEQMGGRLALITAWTVAAAAAAYTGFDAQARRAAAAAIDTAYQIGAPQLAKEPIVTLGFLEVSRSDFPAALRVLEPRLQAFDPIQGTEIEGGGHLPDAIEALCAVGRLDDAERLIDALQHNGEDRDRPWMLAVGARGRGHLLVARGDLVAAQRSVELALEHHERLPMPFEVARTQLLLGQLQRRRRQKKASAMTLSLALSTFERLGAPLWAQRAGSELARLKWRPTAGSGLTAAEDRVAQRAAAGMSNKEIAAELFVSTKTVETNLSSAYRKLGIRSRAQLHTRLSGEDADNLDSTDDSGQ